MLASHYYLLHNLLRHYLDLPLWLVEKTDQGLRWREMNDRVNIRRPTVYEQRYRGKNDWARHIQKGLREVCAGGHPLERDYMGFFAMYVPMPAREQGSQEAQLLYGAHYYMANPTWPQIRDQWKQISGQSSQGDDFAAVEFTRMCLSLPVMTPAMRQAVISLLICFGQWLATGMLVSGGLKRLEKLRLQFAAEMVQPGWIRQVLAEPGIQPRLPKPDMEKWEQEETGLSRLPTVAILLVPRAHNLRGLSACERLVRLRGFQRQAQAMRHQLAETMMMPLAEDGVLMLSAVGNGRSLSLARRQAEALAEKARKLIGTSLGLELVAGVGLPVLPGETLEESRRLAVRATMSALAERQSLHAAPRRGKPGRSIDLVEIEEALVCAVREAVRPAVNVQLAAYLELAANLLGAGMDGLRALFIRTAAAMFREATGSLQKAWLKNEAGLLAARGPDELIDAFRQGVSIAFEARVARAKGEDRIKIEELRIQLARGSLEDQSVHEMAQQYGMSESKLRRLYLGLTGSTPAGDRVLARLKKASRLLVESDLPVQEIALECGFKTVRNFRRSFGLHFHMSPRAFRGSL